MIQVIFFAQTRQLLNRDGLSLEATPNMTVQHVIERTSKQCKEWHLIDEDNLLCARNHTLVTRNTQVISGDTVALFPPVTGG